MVVIDEATRKRARPLHKSNGPVKKQKRDVHKEEASTLLYTAGPQHPGSFASEAKRPATRALKSTASHIRFGSEEPSVESAGHLAEDSEISSEKGTAEEEDESEDEAPEDVSASVAQQAAKDISANLARVSKEQKMKDKRKRQEQAARANEQAASSKRKLKLGNDAQESVQDVERRTVVEENESDEEETPELLPEELLSQDFTRPPNPLSSSKHSIDEGEKKPQRLKLHHDTPTDRQVGPVKVRILQKMNNLLAPKASTKSSAVREAWLAGRRSTGPMVKARKQFNDGFIKR